VTGDSCRKTSRLCVNMQVWLYEHTTRFERYEKRTFPSIGSWGDVYHRGRYHTFELVAGIEETEV